MFFSKGEDDSLWRGFAAFFDNATHEPLCDCEVKRMVREGEVGEVLCYVCYRGPGMGWHMMYFVMDLTGADGMSAEGIVGSMVEQDFYERLALKQA